MGTDTIRSWPITRRSIAVEPCFRWSEDRWCRHCTRTVHAGSSVRSGPLQHTGTQWMLPSQSWKSVEVGVGGHHRASMLDRNCRVLGIGNQLAGGPGFAAQPFQCVQMIGTGTHNACRRPFHERGHEREGLVERRWWVEDAGVGDNADEAEQNQNGERERFRSRHQAGNPGRIGGVIGDGVLARSNLFQVLKAGELEVDCQRILVNTSPGRIAGIGEWA